MIIEEREKLNETQEQFGKRFGVTAMSISYIERGMRKPPLDMIEWLPEPQAMDDYDEAKMWSKRDIVSLIKHLTHEK